MIRIISIVLFMVIQKIRGEGEKGYQHPHAGLTPLEITVSSLLVQARPGNVRRFYLQSGFTLIEVLIVIGILAILAAIVLVAINPSRQFRQANNVQRESNVAALLSAVGQYAVDHKGTLPGEVEADDDPIGGAAGSDSADLCNDLVPTYIPALPVDPLEKQTDTDLSDDDRSITEDECDEAYLTGYTIEEEGGRVVVRAPNTEDVDTGGTAAEPIEMTR